MDLKGLIGAAVAGKVSTREAAAWVEAHRSDYQKPPLLASLREHAPGAEIDWLVDDYSDWEIRMHDLGRRLTELSRLAHQLAGDQPPQAVAVARVLHALSGLHEDPLPRGHAALTLGYVCWQARQFFDAAEALAEAVGLLREGGREPLLEVTALSYLCDSLREDKRFDEAIQRAEELRERARAHGFRGHEALALRDRGQAHAALGREAEALESLRGAVQLRRLLSDEEVRQQSVTPLAAFLNALGLAARQFGHYDEAFQSFFENLEIHTRENDLHFQAIALSEIAYTYRHAGETAMAIDFLACAVQAEERTGPSATAKRWKTQLSLLTRGAIQPFEASPDDPGEESAGPADLTVTDNESAYLLTERASQLAARGKHQEAIRIVSAVLPGLISHRDISAQVTCRNILGICYGQLDRTQEAVKEFQKGIQLADGVGGGAAASLTLRYNLAKVLLTRGQHQSCANVLEAGIAYSEMLLSHTESFASRQQIVAGSLPIYELYVLLVCHTDASPNHERLLGATEVVRARNMAGWARTQAWVEGEGGPAADAGWVGDRLLKLRAAEVELDLRHLTGTLSSTEAAGLQQRARAIQAEIAQKVGAAAAPRDGSFWEAEESLAADLAPGSAVLSLFSVPEGVSPVLYYRDDEGLKSAGSMVAWDRRERLEALSVWSGRAALLRSRAAGQRDLGSDEPASPEASPEHLLDGLLTLTRQRLFDALLGLLGRFKPRRLVVFPHRELALLPYWRLADHCPSLEAVTLVPSLTMMRICAGRRRDLRGPTCLVTDVTGTLSQTAFETATVQAGRGGAVEVVTSVERLIEAGACCNLLHVAAHGAFNPKNPYYSGFLLEHSEAAPGLFVQYARPVSAGGRTSFQFAGQARPGDFRLMTVAECLARLSLGACRLAVLSACECGLADTHGGGELTGLPTSLLVAGAKSVVAPLWPVDDAATALLMAHFYAAWQGGTGTDPSPAAALAAARRRLRDGTREEVRERLGPSAWLPPGDRPFAHPIYTDAFHCFGDW